MKRNYNEEFKPYYDSFIKDLNGLLEIPSVLDKFDKNNLEAPFGKPIREALDYMLKIGERDGFTTVNVDNYAGYLEFGKGEKLLLILCHLDVVPATGVWDNPPFKPIIKDGRIYARGSIDDKGPLMAAYYAIKMLKDNGFNPNMRIRFFFGCDEESGSRGLERYIEKYGECDYGFSPDAEFPCIFAEKGISIEKFSGTIKDDRLVSFKSGTVANVVPDVATCTLKNLNLENEFNEYIKSNEGLKGIVENGTYTLYGKAAHGSIPSYGINAATHLLRFLSNYISNNFVDLVGNYLHEDYFGEKVGINFKDEEMGRVSCNHAIFNLENNKFDIVSNIRYPKGFIFDDKMKMLEDFLKGFGCTLEVLSNSNFHYVPKYSHLVQALSKAYRDNTQDNSEPISIGGGTYARDFKNAVAFGPVFPGESESMHMPNESASLENLIKALFIYQDAVKNICD